MARAGALARLVSLAMNSTLRLCLAAACLCIGISALSPALSLAGDHGVVSAKTKGKCKKGYVRKGSKCKKKSTKKKAPLTVPADGSYNGANGIGLTVATTAGKRSVSVRASIPLTCAPSGATETVSRIVQAMPLSGKAFTGTSPSDPEFGQTTMSGTFASAKSVHLTAQIVDYKNGSDTCTGQLDVTTALHTAP
ncbi:MAG: hypothetical protein JWQ18_136 [Conexibacter sp.]|nr:hypothetical protein [Conexibacter sp.]